METGFDEPTEEMGRPAAGHTPPKKLRCRPAVRSTVVAVELDLGANNAIFIRGQGCELRWDQGEPLTRVGPRRWIWSAESCGERVEFGLLLDDQVWARGGKIVLDPGRTIEITPDFEWPEIPKVANDPAWRVASSGSLGTPDGLRTVPIFAAGRIGPGSR
jgi:hypothetical protein